MKRFTKNLAVLMLAAVVLLAGCTKSSEKQILSFCFYNPEVEAMITESEKTIVASMPNGTDVTALEPVITVSEKASVNPASGLPQDFTNPVIYTVTAEDGTQAFYTVTVTVENDGNNGNDSGGDGPQTYTINVSARPIDGGTVTGRGTFQEGQSCTVTASANYDYLFESWTENGIVVSTDANFTFIVTCNRTLVANFTYDGAPEGAINGKFSINANEDMVYFSQGNLQYHASSGIWQFAENQFDYIGNANNHISPTYSKWIDLFGWGTSGYHDSEDPYNINYQPWATAGYTVDETYNVEGYGPSTNMLSPDLTGSSAEYDWGVHNAISNGGNQAGLWRTLTKEEWTYVINIRSTASGIRYAKACVNNVNGVILLPDDWNSDYYNLNNTNTENVYYYSNDISLSEWGFLEQYGAVFLPAAGFRFGTTTSCPNSYGLYWSATHNTSQGAYSLMFEDSFLVNPQYDIDNARYCGESVRLVRDIQ